MKTIASFEKNLSLAFIQIVSCENHVDVIFGRREKELE